MGTKNNHCRCRRRCKAKEAGGYGAGQAADRRPVPPPPPPPASVLHVALPREQRKLGALQLAAQVICVLQVGDGAEAVVGLQNLHAQLLGGAAAPGARGQARGAGLAGDDLTGGGVAGQACRGERSGRGGGSVDEPPRRRLLVARKNRRAPAGCGRRRPSPCSLMTLV